MLESKTLATVAPPEVRPTSGLAIQDQVVELFDELRVPLLRYLSGFPLSVPDSEDIIQEAFLALFEHLGRGGSHPNIRGWLFRTAHNLALKKRLRVRRNGGPALEMGLARDVAIDPAPNPEVQLASHQTRERLMAVVRALPEQNRWCLYLRAEGLRYREIAAVLDISLGSVALYLERSLALVARAAER